MNRPIASALLRDAYAQVVDNFVFRLLLVVLVAFVLPTFLVQLGPEGLRIAFSFEYSWDDLIGGQELFGAGDRDLHVQLIEWIQTAVADHLAGKLGVLLCVAATAFFVPRMLEKGAADTLFSKPVPRWLLLLSRYVAGILFVSLLAFGLIGGMHLGFQLVSGHSREGFLWSIPMLIYLFAVMHAFSVTVGVLTRSSVAAILLTAAFFLTSSCVHGGWELKQSFENQMAEDTNDLELERSGALRLVSTVLDVAHAVLPKTRDARRLVHLTRQRVQGPDSGLLDPSTGLTAGAPPEGFERLPGGSFARDGAVWVAPEPDGGESRIFLERLPNEDLDHIKGLARDLETELEARPEVSSVSSHRSGLAGRAAHGVRWREERPSGERLRERWFFAGSGSTYALAVDISVARDADPAFAERLAAFLDGLSFGAGGDGLSDTPFADYDRRFGWDAPLAYNAWFSVVSTLAFTLAVLLFGAWRLSRIDF